MTECILVTGGCGSIGAHLIKTLAERGKEVISFDVVSPTPELQIFLKEINSNITFVKGSLLDMASLMYVVKKRKVEKIVHLGAVFNPSESQEMPYYTYQVNVVGTLNVIETARVFDLKRLVNISTISVYPEKQYEPIDEKHPVLVPGKSPTNYGVSKAAAELLGLAYWHNNGVNYVALRFSAVFGLGIKLPGLIEKMVESSIRKKAVKFDTGGDLYRDFTYVKDCVNGIICALDADDSKLTKRVYHVTSGEFYSAIQVAKIVAEIIPGAQIEVRPELSDSQKEDAATRGKLDISMAKKELGYEPRFKLREAIHDYVEMYKKWTP